MINNYDTYSLSSEKEEYRKPYSKERCASNYFNSTNQRIEDI